MDKIAHLKKLKEEFLSGLGTPEKGVFKADPFQLEAISSVTNNQDTLVVAPTGAGKTFIATQAITAVTEQNARAIYTTPLKALSNGKYSELKQKFAPEKTVGLLTGDRKVNITADVVVATTEIYRNELYGGYSDYSLVVLDEVHYISDQQRGAVWEEAIIFTPADTTLLMLSASISNYKQIAAWIEHVRKKPCKVVIATERPVALRLGFMHPDYGGIPLYKDQAEDSAAVSPYVAEYYAGQILDSDGMRLKQKGRSPGKNSFRAKGQSTRAKSRKHTRNKSAKKSN